MPKIKYISKRFSTKSQKLIDIMNEIISEYSSQGLDLTLRQLYYQLVSRNTIENTEREYKNTGNILNDARLAGLIDWNSIADRTRNLRILSFWDSPKDILESAADSYRIDIWENQHCRPEVWIEKEALIGVISDVCELYRVPYFACRGYVSQSEMWAAAEQRFKKYQNNGKIPVIIHLGDHDPSGIDMTRDIKDRLSMFLGEEYSSLKRIALNFNQVQTFNLPPNPAKVKDSRFVHYSAKFGTNSWELDALEPGVISSLIEDAIKSLIDNQYWTASEQREKIEQSKIYELLDAFNN